MQNKTENEKRRNNFFQVNRIKLIKQRASDNSIGVNAVTFAVAVAAVTAIAVGGMWNLRINKIISVCWWCLLFTITILFSHEAFVIEFIAVIKMHKFSFEICSCLHYEYSIFGKPFVLARATILPFIAFAQIIFISCSNKKDQLIFTTFKININVKS